MDLGSRAIEYYGLRERKIFSIFLPYLVERIESVTERLKISPNMAKKIKKILTQLVLNPLLGYPVPEPSLVDICIHY